MVKNVTIKNVGSFIEFTNNQTPFSSGKAVIHGLNGSGKSQFCSLLQLMSKLKSVSEKDEKQYQKVSDEIIDFMISRKSKDNNENTITLQIDSFTLNIDVSSRKFSSNGMMPNMHVFNEVYIAANIGDIVDLPEKEIRIGEQNKLRDGLLRELRETRKATSKVHERINDKVSIVRKESGYMNQTRTKNIITKEKYLELVNPCESFPKARAILRELSEPPDLIQSHIGRTLPNLGYSPEQRDRIDTIFSNIYIEPLLQQTVYQRYLQDRKQFYEDGVSLFNDLKDVCPFCLTPKRSDDAIIGELIDYLGSDYNEALNDLHNLTLLLESYKKRIDEFIKTSNGNNPAIRATIKKLTLDISLTDIEYNDSVFQAHFTTIESKRYGMSNTQLLVGVSLPDLIDDSLSTIYKQYNQKIQVITAVNREIEQLKTRKRTLGEEIIKNCMHEFWKDDSLRERLSTLHLDEKRIEHDLSKMADALKSDKTIGFFNQIIRCLGIYKYELDENSNLILKLEKDHDITNEGFRISAGERKFIAISYFLAEVLSSVSNSSELSELSIFIDDPVDSSDYQKFYSFVSVIENLEEILQTMYHNQDITLGACPRIRYQYQAHQSS